MLYFDHNATSPLCAAGRTAWLEATERFVGNPSSPHRLGARASVALEEAREKLASWLGGAPRDIVWTSGATEGNNAALHHAAAEEGEAWISAIEHPCLLEASRRFFSGRLQHIPVTPAGVVDLDWLRAAFFRKKPALVAVMAANNETGVLQPWEEIAALCREQNVAFLCDAAQWLGKMAPSGLGACDFVTGCAHKFGGPQGVGFLKVPANFRPLIVGGMQEEGRRAGTENVAGVLASVAALEQRTSQLNLTARRKMREDAEAAILDAVPAARIVGGTAERLWNTIEVIMPELPDCRQRWVVKLDKLGFAVSTGSACASGKEQTSHVLAAMGCSAAEASQALRFSSGWETELADWLQLAAALKKASAEI
ncbi:MAG TPA: cysteine desulfurase family protein [Chthoniobacteraceae bacterium]